MCAESVRDVSAVTGCYLSTRDMQYCEYRPQYRAAVPSGLSSVTEITPMRGNEKMHIRRANTSQKNKVMCVSAAQTEQLIAYM